MARKAPLIATPKTDSCKSIEDIEKKEKGMKIGGDPGGTNENEL